jgi:hypothetical protein
MWRRGYLFLVFRTFGNNEVSSLFKIILNIKGFLIEIVLGEKVHVRVLLRIRAKARARGGGKGSWLGLG